MRKWKNSGASGGRKIHRFHFPRRIILESAGYREVDEITEGIFKGFPKWRAERYGDILPKHLILRSIRKD